MTLAKLQEHVNHRAKRKGIRNRPLSPITIRKEAASRRAAWNWAIQMGYVTGGFPNRGLKYPKIEEKPPFQTWAEIERQISRSVTPALKRDLWDCLFLTLPEIAELLAYVKVVGRHAFVYPMFCFAAHSRARRSEILRVRIGDVDLDARMYVKCYVGGRLPTGWRVGVTRLDQKTAQYMLVFTRLFCT